MCGAGGAACFQVCAYVNESESCLTCEWEAVMSHI